MKLELTAEERNELMRLVDNSLGETRVGVRRTRTTDFREQLEREEDLLQVLHAKLQQLGEISAPLAG